MADPIAPLGLSSNLSALLRTGCSEYGLSSKACTTIWRNEMDSSVQLLWVDYSGNFQQQANLQKGSGWSASTFDTHIWVVAQDGRIITQQSGAWSTAPVARRPLVGTKHASLRSSVCTLRLPGIASKLAYLRCCVWRERASQYCEVVPLRHWCPCARSYVSQPLLQASTPVSSSAVIHKLVFKASVSPVPMCVE